VVAVDGLHRGVAVAAEPVEVAGADQGAEQAEVAAEVEDAGDGGAADEVAEGLVAAVGGAEPGLDVRVHGGHVAEQLRAEAGPAFGLQAAPEHAAGGVHVDVDGLVGAGLGVEAEAFGRVGEAGRRGGGACDGQLPDERHTPCFSCLPPRGEGFTRPPADRTGADQQVHYSNHGNVIQQKSQ
jgi:hypothetical protein